jgi:hypothetical protein
MIGIFGLLLVLAASIYQFARNGVGTAGVPAGKHLHYFVAPLASSGERLDANTHPRCDPVHPNPRGLNICGRTPLVLAFFTTASDTCKRQVDALQTLSAQFPRSGVQFAAVAVQSSRPATVAALRSHRWRIPIAYDRDGAIGALYGVQVCPMVELAYRGGLVAERLIGSRWVSASALEPKVKGLLARGAVHG